jgi:hypothetical protein
VPGINWTAQNVFADHPVLSDDELTLYYNTTPGGTMVATRAKTTDPFGPGKPINLAVNYYGSSMSWISADGCVAYLTVNQYPTKPYITIRVATRGL